MKRTSRWFIGMGILFLLISVPGLRAQEKTQGLGGGYFLVGENWTSLSDLNAALAKAGYGRFSENGVAFGGGGFGIRGRLLLGGMGAGSSNGSMTANGNKVELSGGFGLFDMGYVLFSGSAWRVYPMIGIGGGGFTLKIYSQEKPAGFQELLKNPCGELQLTSGNVLLNFGVGFHALLGKKERKNEEGIGGFLIGVRLGYLLSVYTSGWDAARGSVPDGPSAPFTGPYVYLTLGGGGGQ